MAESSGDTAVEVVPYDPGWPELFDAEADALMGVLNDQVAAIEHIGSTAVPGMWAKPIVDIMVGTQMPSRPTSGQIDLLDSVGYVYQREDGRRPGRFIFHKRKAIWCNLSVVPYASQLWNDNIYVRDFLAAHPEVAASYSSTKRREAAQPESLQDYQDGKREFVDELRRRARAWATSTQSLT